MANVGNITLEQIEGARGGEYYVCRAIVQIGTVTHIAEIASNDVPELQPAIHLLVAELKKIAILMTLSDLVRLAPEASEMPRRRWSGQTMARSRAEEPEVETEPLLVPFAAALSHAEPLAQYPLKAPVDRSP